MAARKGYKHRVSRPDRRGSKLRAGDEAEGLAAPNIIDGATGLGLELGHGMKGKVEGLGLGPIVHQ